MEGRVRANNLCASLWVQQSGFQSWLRSLCHVFRQNSFLSASQRLYLFRGKNRCQEFIGLAHQTFCYLKHGLQSVCYPWTAVCTSPQLCSLYFTPGRQSVLHPRSAVCILSLVCSLYFTPGLQSVFYPWSAVCIFPQECSL